METNTYITTIRMPQWLAEEIKAEHMTYTGAMIAGWLAIKERKTHNLEREEWMQEAKDLKDNMNKYRMRYIELSNRVAELEAPGGTQ